MATNIDKAILAGEAAIRAELDRQERIYERQLQSRYSNDTPARSRFAVAAHMTKTERKIWRLQRALDERTRR